MGLSKSQLVHKMAQKAFKDCDLDGTGTIDAKELHVGLLLVYDKLNDKLPVHLNPPDHDTVAALLRKYDADGTGTLDFEEFHECVSSVLGVNERARVTDSLPWMVASRVALKMLIFPVAAVAIKALLNEVRGVNTVSKRLPNAAFAFGVEGIYKAARLKLTQ